MSREIIAAIAVGVAVFAGMAHGDMTRAQRDHRAPVAIRQHAPAHRAAHVRRSHHHPFMHWFTKHH